MPQSPKPSLFVGSSSEAQWLIRGIRHNLGDGIDVLDWSTMALRLSRHILDDIERALDEADFAAFILSADDVSIIRGEHAPSARDNVLFELGISFGHNKRNRTFILAPGESDLRRPSDLLGISVIQYVDTRTDRTSASAMKIMAGPADKLFHAIEREGLKDRPGDGVPFERGDTSRLDTIADGAFHVFESRNQYADQLRAAVLGGARVPAKFQYAQPDGGSHWLRLCESTNYHYFHRAKQHLANSMDSLVEKVAEVSDTAAVDLISLGSGDGSKDDIMLRELTAQLSDNEYVYYYPIDISDSLLVQAVRHVSRHGLDRRRFRCKPVLGDFTDLSSLNAITAHRPNTNIFSVLGNALGSFDEYDILASISGAMQPGDLVLIEANIGEPVASIALHQDDVANQWDLSTLAALRIPLDSCELRQDTRTNLSTVPGTRTLVSYAVALGDAGATYTLSAMHHYDFEALKASVARKLNVVIIDDFTEAGVGLVLAQRPRGGTRRGRRLAQT